MNGAHGSNGGEVVGGHDGFGERVGDEHLDHGLVAAADGVVALLDEVGGDGEAAPLHSLDESFFAKLGGVIFGGSGDVGDGGMADGVEVFDGGLDAGLIVDDEAGDFFCRAGRVEEDEWDALLVEVFEDPGVHFGGHDGDAVDFSLEHAAGAVLGADGIIAGVGDQDFLAVAHGDIFKAFDQFGEERVCNVGDDESVEAGAAGAERAGVCIRVVAELLDGAADAKGSFIAYFVRAIDGPGNGRSRDFCDARYFLDIHAGSPRWCNLFAG